ncbi:MAG: hypothetical protein ACQERB_07060 [Promethearchaeati archaeon]
MNAKKKLELIDTILERHHEGSCLYCGGTLNRDLLGEDWDEMNPDTYCTYCGKDIDPYDEWDQMAIEAIAKVLNDERFKA